MFTSPLGGTCPGRVCCWCWCCFWSWAQFMSCLCVFVSCSSLLMTNVFLRLYVFLLPLSLSPSIDSLPLDWVRM